MIRKYAAFFPFAFFLFILVLGACNFFEPQPIPDLDKVELTAGPDVNVAASAITATVTFTGAAGLTLTKEDFAVSEGGTIDAVSVGGDGTVSVTVTFAANTGTAKIYTVGIAANNAKIKGNAAAVIIQGADPRKELTAGSATVSDTTTSATVTFIGAAGLTLTAEDFTVSEGGTIKTVSVSGDTVSVTVTFAANTTTAAKTYTVGIKVDSTKIKGGASVAITQKSLSATFVRPPSGMKAYTLVEYDPAVGVAVLKEDKAGSTDTPWLVEDVGLKTLFNAIYTPNAPGTADSVELDNLADPKHLKASVAYTAEISEKALGLFKITVGSNAVDDKVEITGNDSALPTAPGASAVYPIIIDIGLPGGADNSGLPTFYIPLDSSSKKGTLGDGSASYAHIRLRVNKGAKLVIEADNSAYITRGAGNSCPPGNFKDGCVEVMAGGKLRDGAYEGFPLGANAVILNRSGSYLAVGPESSFTPDSGEPDYDKYYSGWLVGPDSTDVTEKPRIKWDSNNDPSDYLEVRPGKLAISANVTVQKGLGLIYSVWFIGDTTVTINVSDGAASGLPGRGLFANGPDYKFYGTKDKAKIDIKQGSMLHKMFLTGNDNTFTGGPKTITNAGTGTPVEYTGGITGYPDWAGY